MLRYSIWLLVLAFTMIFTEAIAFSGKPEKLAVSYQSAFVHFDGINLQVGTGKITRSWKWTGSGFVTSSLINTRTKKEWCTATTAGADWMLPGRNALPHANIIALKAFESDDDGFTNRHLQLITEIDYPSLQMTLKYVVWAFPESGGLRTQLFIKSKSKSETVIADVNGFPPEQIKIVSSWPESTGNHPVNALFDGLRNTEWMTRIQTNSFNEPAQIILDLQKQQQLTGIAITEPQDYTKKGYVNKCVVYVSNDTLHWGLPVGSAEFNRVDYRQYMPLSSNQGRFIKIILPPTRIVNAKEWQTACSELSLFTKQYPYRERREYQTDFYPLKMTGTTLRGMGYYGDTQFRNDLDLPFYTEKNKVANPFMRETWDWNNILSIEVKSEGLCLVKESQKTVLQYGHLTGSFISDRQGVQITGWGLDLNEITDQYRESWANWCIVYHGSEADRQWAVKTFDRARFPTSLPGDRSVMSCTWGFGNKENSTGRDCQDGALEKNVLTEMNAAKDIGIETLLIDDGWQSSSSNTGSSPDGGIGWKPNPLSYPEGWKNVVAEAKNKAMNLALWSPITSWNGVPGITFGDLLDNQEKGKFINWKFDFAILDDYQTKNEVETKARNFISRFDHKIALHWDLTENWPRYGFYWGRQYGTIWLANRGAAAQIIYRPSTVLRDAWEIARYVNIDKFQLGIRNIDSLPAKSDAKLYNHAYATAISFVGVPVFFEKLQSYSPQARDEVRSTLNIYKEIRDSLKQCYIFPIGNQPDNASFTGFQGISEDRRSGLLLIFREIYATSDNSDFKLNFAVNKRIRLLNMRHKTEQIVQSDENGTVNFKVGNPADFLIYSYHILN